MAPIAGTYRMVTSDNLTAECEATFSTFLSPADLKLIAAPDNLWTLVIREKVNGLIFKAEYSKTPQFNGTYEYKYGEETTFPGCPGSTVMTLTDPNTLTEVWKDAEGGGSHSYVLKFDGFGATVRTSTSARGVVATSVWERVNPPTFEGFYLLESHENVEAFMSHLSKEQVAEMFTGAALRITKSEDNIYTSVDYFGTGEKKVVFRLGEQQELGALPDFQMKDVVLLVTQTGPTTLSYLAKDRASTKVQAWTAEVTESNITWSVEAAPGVVTRFKYRRVGDIMGSWKLAVMGDISEHMDAMGVPPAVQTVLKEEKPTISFTYLGKGLWEYVSDSKQVACGPTILRMGEECVLEMANIGSISMLYNFTRDGMVGVRKLGGKVVASTTKILKDFSITEDSVVGVPGTHLTTILTKV